MARNQEVEPRNEVAEARIPSVLRPRPFLIRVLRACWLVAALSRPRYLALTLPPFVIAELWTPGHNNWYLALGVFQIVLLRTVSSLSNCVSDQTEDVVDHPRRVSYCKELGYSTLHRVVQVAAFIYAVSLVYLALAVHITGVAIGLWMVFLVLKLAYSYGPRLKPRRHSATLLLGGLSAGMFTVGWFGCTLQWSNSAACVAFLLWTVGSCLCGSKDAPNLQGDANIGYRSPFVRVRNRQQPIAITAFIVGLPILISIVTATVTGRIAFATPVAVVPVVIVFVRMMINAEIPLDFELVRELGYTYWITFMATLLIGLAPARTEVVTTMVVSAAWYVTASWWLHPDPTALTLDGLRRGFAASCRRISVRPPEDK